MAASGINEHHEACRKQHVINRQAYTKKQFVEKALGTDHDIPGSHEKMMSRCSHGPPGHLGPVSSYDMEKYQRQNGANGTDKARRKAVRQEQYLTYSAKINGRLSSQDYVQQW